MRVPNALWDRVKTHAEKLNKSATATAAQILEDCLNAMDAEKPEVPKIVKLSHFLRENEPEKK